MHFHSYHHLHFYHSRPSPHVTTTVDATGNPYVEKVVIPETITGARTGLSTMSDADGEATGLAVIVHNPDYYYTCEPDTSTQSCGVNSSGLTFDFCFNACLKIGQGTIKCLLQLQTCWCDFFTANAKNVADCIQCLSIFTIDLQAFPDLLSNIGACGFKTTATTECFSSTIYGMCQSTPIPSTLLS